MKFLIDKSLHEPAYLQLYKLIKEQIIAGQYPLASKLPSKRTVAAEAGVSVISVEHAYALLADEGYIEARERSGYFVIYRESDFGRSFIPTPKPAPPAPQVSATAFPYSVLAKTMRRVITEQQENLLIKSPNQGCVSLRRALSAYLLRSNGIKADEKQIVIGAGAEYLYGLIIQLLGNGRVFGLEDPGYEKIGRVYRANGVQTDLLKLGRDGILSEELNRTRATVLHVTPFHSFPSGISADVSKRREYVCWAEARNGYIIEDNYDSELTVSSKNEDTVFATAKEGTVIYLNTFTKTVAPSVRVGYMILPSPLLRVFEQKLGFYSCTVPVFEQEVLAELIAGGDFERHINRVRRARRKRLSEQTEV